MMIDNDDYNRDDDEDFVELIDHVLHPRAPQTYRNRPNHFNNWNNKDFKARFRLEKEVVQFLIEHISDDISSATERLLVYLFHLHIRYLPYMISIKFPTSI